MKKQGETRQRWQEMPLLFQRTTISTVLSPPMRNIQMCSQLQRISTSLWINFRNHTSKVPTSRLAMVVHSVEFLNKMESSTTNHKALHQTDSLQNESTSLRMPTSLMAILTSASVAILPWSRASLNTMLKTVQTLTRETMRLTYATMSMTTVKSAFKPVASSPKRRCARNGFNQRQ